MIFAEELQVYRITNKYCGVKWGDIYIYTILFTIKKSFKSNWEDGIKNSSKLAIYSHFKCYLIPESYLEIIKGTSWDETFSMLSIKKKKLYEAI